MNLLGNHNTSVSVLKDPFKKDCVNNISFRYHVKWGGEKEWYARVNFTNGKTSGEQAFDDYSEFMDLVRDVQNFIDTL